VPNLLKDVRKGVVFPSWLRETLRSTGLYAPAQRLWHPIKYKLYDLQSPYLVEIDGMTAEFKIRDGFDEKMVTDHAEDERKLLADIVSSVGPSDVFGDLGANIGLFSALAGQNADRTVAFEPHPDNYDRLRENLSLNSVAADMFQIALSDTEGNLEFILPPDIDVTGGAAIVSGEEEQKEHFRKQYGGFRTEVVSSMTGDSFFQRHDVPSPTVLKIDVEGAEMNVLQGLETTIAASDVRLIYVEVHRFIDDFGFEQQDVNDFLEGRGFETETLLEYQNGNYFLRAER